MFEGFPASVGVANVRTWWDELEFKPKFVTERAEGAGWRELVDHILTPWLHDLREGLAQRSGSQGERESVATSRSRGFSRR